MKKKIFFWICLFLLAGISVYGSEKPEDGKKEDSAAEAKPESAPKKDGAGEEVKGKGKEKEKEKEDENQFMGIKKINDYIPKEWKDKLKVNLDVRYHFESQENKFDFSDANPTGPFDQDGFSLLRTRLTIDFTPIKMIRAFVQLQDSRIWDQRIPELPNKAFYEDSLDLRQFYLDFILGLGEKNSFTVRIGRQELIYGKERLVGGFNWSNTAQSFDGIMGIFKMDKLQADIFAVRKVVIDYDSWNDWDEHDNFFGIYLKSKHLKDHELDVYAFYRDTDGQNLTPTPFATVDEITLGFRFAGKQKALDYSLEFAYQFGRAGRNATRNDISAYAVASNIGLTCACPFKFRLGIGLDYASGDNNRLGGGIHTFDNLYPTNHLYYGFMDLAAWQNIFDVVFSFSAKPTSKVSVKMDLHLLSLDTSQDAFYNAGRAPRFGGITGPEYVGTELDFVVGYEVNKFFSLAFGYTKFWTGAYLRSVGGTPRRDNAEFVYFESTLKF